MQVLDSALLTKRLMVVGVNRYYPEITRTVSIKLISYARSKANYRYILAPVSPACGALLDRFVYQNDYSVLNDLSLILSYQDILFYKRLNTLNEGKTDSLKLRIIGIDIENQLKVPALGIFNLIKDRNPPDRLRIPIEALQGAIRYQQLSKDSLDNYDGQREFPVRNTYKAFAQSFDTLKNVYKEWLGDDEWFRMESYVESLNAVIQFEKLKNTALEDPFRVQQIEKNIIHALKSLPNERFMAIIGRCYASKTWLQGTCQLYNFSPLCSKLSEDKIAAPLFFNVGVYYNEAADSEDESQEVKAALRSIRSGAPATSASLYACDKSNTMLPFNYLLVMGGIKPANKPLPDNVVSQINKGIPSRPLFSAGANVGFHIADVFALSNLMAGFGLPEIDIKPDYGLNISTRDKENFLYEAGYFQQARLPGSAYHYWGTYFALTNEFFSATPWMKGGIGMNFGYQQHIVNNPYTLNDTIFISRYTMPTRAVNPVFTVGLSAKGKISFSRFFLTAEVGYARDCSDRRWRVNNRYSGPMGKFNGEQIFINIATGFHLITTNPKNRKDYP